MKDNSLQKKDNRIVGLDILKIISMIMIISLHYFGQGGVRETVTPNNWNYYFVWFFDILSLISVNCYILCSGYLMVENRFKIRKLVSLWLQIVSINIFCFIINYFVNSAGGISINDVLNVFFPVITNEYWYVSSYFAFYIISPLLIFVVKKLSVEQLGRITFVSILLFSIFPTDWTQIHYGYSFIWFVALFFIAAYLRESKKYDEFSGKYLIKYFGFSLITMALKLVFDLIGNRIGIDSLGGHFATYTFITVLLASLMFFSFFKNIKAANIKISRLISIITSTTFGIFLIHVNPLMINLLWTRFFDVNAYISKPSIIRHYVTTVLLIFCVCAIIDLIRQLIFKLLRVDKISLFAEKVISKVLEIIKEKII